MSKATPRPWKAPFIDENDADVISITDEDQMFGICVCREYSCESKEQMKANADLIVRAVNVHEELVEQVEFLYEHVKLTPYRTEQLHDLLKRAKGEK